MSRRKRDETAEPEDGRDSLHHRKKTHAKEVSLTACMIEDHDALAIVESEETGEVRIFHHGSIFM